MALSVHMSQRRSDIWYCLRVFLGVRAGLWLLGLVAVAVLPANEHTSLPGWQLIEGPGWSNLFTAWERWDALWFLQIATQGYSEGDFSAAFFPLYPLLIRIISPLVGGHPLAAAMLISNAAFFGAMLVFHELTVREFDRETARRSVLYVSIFPTAYFFFAPYTESLFLLLAVSAFLAARSSRWEIAGTAAALASATRSIGILLALPLALEAIRQARAADGARMKRLLTGLFWSAFTVVGMLTYMYFWYRANGDPMTPLSDQNGWLREFSWPWQSIRAGTSVAFQFIGQYSGGYHLIDWLFFVAGAAAVAWALLRTELPFGVYALASFLMPLFLVFGGRPFMSLPRFLLPIFPMYWAMAAAAKKFDAHQAIVAASAAGLGFLALLFVNWYWVF